MIDGAGWHTSQALKPPDNISLLCLPPYSPELNPVENVWEYLRKNKLALRIHDRYEDIVEACCEAWNDLIADPARTRIDHATRLGQSVMNSGRLV